jgi:hypothetical protein
MKAQENPIRKSARDCYCGFGFSGDVGERVVLIGYMRVSKSDSSQVLHLQRDALLIVAEGEPVAPLASPCP